MMADLPHIVVELHVPHCTSCVSACSLVLLASLLLVEEMVDAFIEFAVIVWKNF